MEQIPGTLQRAIVHFSDFENCKKFMVELRWPDGTVTCPQCGSDNVTYLEKARVWKCYGKHPRAKFSLKTGTIFEDSPLGLDKWLPAAWLVINCKNGVSSYEIGRALGVTQKSAWFMMHRVRLAMRSGSFKKMSGEIEADETFIGGLARNMHASRRNKIFANGTLDTKTVVMGLLERHGAGTSHSTVHTKILPTVSGMNLRNAVRESVEPGSTLYTDENAGYKKLGDSYAHHFINHAETYARGAVHTNGLENFWSLLKRGIKGTYVSVEPFHMFRYLDEQAFRFNNRDLTDPERFGVAMKQIVGRRLTYKELTGATEVEPG